jgi:hypothetical protein
LAAWSASIAFGNPSGGSVHLLLLGAIVFLFLDTVIKGRREQA